MVVNAQGVKDNLKYMITFFLNNDHYNVERGLYRTAPLKGLVPRAHMYDESDPLTGPDGSSLPHAIVLERGETVSEWVGRRAPDANVKAEVSCTPVLVLSMYYLLRLFYKERHSSRAVRSSTSNKGGLCY